MLPPMKSVIQRNRVKLVRNLDVQEATFWTYLISARVISFEQVDTIRSCNKANHQQVSALISHLERRPDSDIDKFINALLQTGRGHIASFLLEAQHSAQQEKPKKGRYNPYQRGPSTSLQKTVEERHPSPPPTPQQHKEQHKEQQATKQEEQHEEVVNLHPEIPISTENVVHDTSGTDTDSDSETSRSEPKRSRSETVVGQADNSTA